MLSWSTRNPDKLLVLFNCLAIRSDRPSGPAEVQAGIFRKSVRKEFLMSSNEKIGNYEVTKEGVVTRRD
ncbi:MAG: hypothetical protein KGS72_15395, partial [Cyanobacteria bacterium REEB67]|nr:hypothetical protein [Cyanobacteria bacterium REEB67]